jgi:hypothetical protein
MRGMKRPKGNQVRITKETAAKAATPKAEKVAPSTYLAKLKQERIDLDNECEALDQRISDMDDKRKLLLRRKQLIAKINEEQTYLAKLKQERIDLDNECEALDQRISDTDDEWKPLSDKKALLNLRRKQLIAKINEEQKIISYEEQWVKTPRTEPKNKIIIDSYKNKWDYQREYFMKALEPARDAWLDHANEICKTGELWDFEELAKAVVWNECNEKFRPEEFPNEFIRIEVPGAGKYLIKNTAAAIYKILKSAPTAFSKPKCNQHPEGYHKILGENAKQGRPNPELNPEKLILFHEKQIAELRDKRKKLTDAKDASFNIDAKDVFNIDEQIKQGESDLREARNLKGGFKCV